MDGRRGSTVHRTVHAKSLKSNAVDGVDGMDANLLTQSGPEETGIGGGFWRAVVVGDAPAGSQCVQCFSSGGQVLKIRDRRTPGGKTEALHTECAEVWFEGLDQ